MRLKFQQNKLVFKGLICNMVYQHDLFRAVLSTAQLCSDYYQVLFYSAAPVPPSSLSSQPLPSVSSSSHKPPDSPAAVIRNSTHGYVTPPVPTPGRGGQFIMDSRWPTVPTGDVQDPRRCTCISKQYCALVCFEQGCRL